MVKSSFKNGFSLMEALISMLIISIFFVASTKVMTTKQKDPPMRNPHGYYECYKLANGVVYEHTNNSDPVTINSLNDCSIQPPQGAAFVNLHYRGSSGSYYTRMVPYTSNALSLEDVKDILDTRNPSDNPYKQSNLQNFREYLQQSHSKAKMLEKFSSLKEGMFVAW